MKRETNFKDGQIVIYYNKWEDFDNKEILNSFETLSQKELNSLEVGKKIWIDEDPYDMKGKVYGFTHRKISKIVTRNNNRRVYIGGSNFFTADSDAKCYKIKEGLAKKLIKFINEKPSVSMVH